MLEVFGDFFFAEFEAVLLGAVDEHVQDLGGFALWADVEIIISQAH